MRVFLLSIIRLLNRANIKVTLFSTWIFILPTCHKICFLHIYVEFNYFRAHSYRSRRRVLKFCNLFCKGNIKRTDETHLLVHTMQYSFKRSWIEWNYFFSLFVCFEVATGKDLLATSGNCSAVTKHCTILTCYSRTILQHNWQFIPTFDWFIISTCLILTHFKVFDVNNSWKDVNIITDKFDRNELAR